MKEPQNVLATFAMEQVAKLVAFRATTLSESRIQTLACLILDTGLRVGEALSLNRLTDIDLDQASVMVRHGKGGKSRVVPICHQLRRLLFRLIQANQLKYGDLLFFADAGEPLEQRNALRDFKQLCNQVGIRGVRVRTDGWRGYWGLEGYVHDRQVQSHQKEGVHLLPRVHRVIALLRRWLLAPTKVRLDRSIWTLTWVSSSFDSSAANPNLAANCSIDWLSKPCMSAPSSSQPWSNHNLS